MKKIYYKLTVSKTVDRETIKALTQAFWLMETCHGRRWLQFWGQSEDLETAAFLLKQDGIECKLTYWRGARN